MLKQFILDENDIERIISGYFETKQENVIASVEPRIVGERMGEHTEYFPKVTVTINTK